MLPRLDPISVVRLLVFAEIWLLIWHPASRFNSWDEINMSLEHSEKRIHSYNTAVLKSIQWYEDEPAYHDRVHPFWEKIINVTNAENLILKKTDSLKSCIQNKARANKEIIALSIREIDSLTHKYNSLIHDNVNMDESVMIARTLPIADHKPFDNLLKKDKLLTRLHNITGRQRVTAVLSSLQIDVVNSTSIFLRYMQRETAPRDCFLNFLDAISLPDKCHAIPGEFITGKVMMVSNTAIKPEITMNEGALGRVENGIACWYSKAKSPGWQTISGNVTIHLRKPDTSITKPYSFKYFVGEPYIQLYIKDQNFIYANVPSPVTVEGYGYAVEDMKLEAPGAEVTSISPGHFQILVTPPHKATITAKLMAKDKTGKTVAVDAMNLNIIDPPLPIAGFGTNTGGAITVNYLRQHDTLNAQLRDTDIGGIPPVITQYEVSYFSKENPEEVGPYMIHGKSLDDQPEIKQILMKAKKGDRIIINGIKCRYLDGRLFSLDPLSYIVG